MPLEFTDFAVTLRDGPPTAHRAEVSLTFQNAAQWFSTVNVEVIIYAPLETTLAEIHQLAADRALAVMAEATTILTERSATEITEEFWAVRRAEGE